MKRRMTKVTRVAVSEILLSPDTSAELKEDCRMALSYGTVRDYPRIQEEMRGLIRGARIKYATMIQQGRSAEAYPYIQDAEAFELDLSR